VALRIDVSLLLPRDEVTVPIARHLCDFALTELAVTRTCRGDILLAMTEACTNVIEHSDDDHPYEVSISFDTERCTVRVTDPGSTADTSRLDRSRQPRTDVDADLTADSGRGISLMQALVDKLQFESVPHDGMVVHLCKELEFDEASPVRARLAQTP
jgi:serine/threonine-protein kinase RsbW